MEDGDRDGKRNQYTVVFVDVHYVDTQIKPSENGGNLTSKETEGSNITINNKNDARLQKVGHNYRRMLYYFSHNIKDCYLQVKVVFLSKDVRSCKLALAEQLKDNNGGPLY